jgi:hypothetical protein
VDFPPSSELKENIKTYHALHPHVNVKYIGIIKPILLKPLEVPISVAAWSTA